MSILIIIDQSVSEAVLGLIDDSCALNGIKFDENEVDGGIAEIAVACDEDFFVAMAYVAYCITFRREVKLDDFDVSRERDKMVDFIT